MQAHFIWQLAFLLHGQPCATTSSTVPGSEPFLFLFFSAVFFVYKSGSSYLKQRKGKEKEKQRNIFFVIYHLCAVYSYSLSTVPWHPRRLDPRHRRRRDLILRSQPALCEALPGARPLGVGVSRLVVALPAQPDRLDAAVHEEEGGHDPVWADNKHQFD